MKEEPETCRNCHYYRTGECRISPPAAFLDADGQIAGRFPKIEPDKWCGDWCRRLNYQEKNTDD